MKKDYTDTLGETKLDEESKEEKEIKSATIRRRISINIKEARGCKSLLQYLIKKNRWDEKT